jgi:hypothetical protein
MDSLLAEGEHARKRQKEPSASADIVLIVITIRRFIVMAGTPQTVGCEEPARVPAAYEAS